MDFKRRFSLVEREEIVHKSCRCLWGDSGKPGRDYLLQKRGLSEQTAKEFQLGYIPVFVKHQLRGRVILPLFDPSRNLIAISSREILKSEKNFLPVYWHESYQKPFYLYGIENAYKELRRSKFSLVVEGQFDVLQLHNHGIRNVVGLCGNKMSDVQVSVINRYCQEIVLILDKDENEAGQRSAEKIVAQSCFQLQMSLGDKMKFPVPWHQQKSFSTMRRKILSVFLPENSDPDEFVRTHGVQELRKIIKGKRHEFANRY
jgi:DNA primase